jgi:hypothetical protein
MTYNDIFKKNFKPLLRALSKVNLRLNVFFGMAEFQLMRVSVNLRVNIK